MAVTVAVVSEVDQADALHQALAQAVDPAMMCDQKRAFPPSPVVAAAVAGPDLRLYAAYDDGTPIGAMIVVVGTEHPKYRQIVWFYAAAGHHDDAAQAIGVQVVADVGTPSGDVQNAAVRDVFQRAFPGHVVVDANAVTYQP